MIQKSKQESVIHKSSRRQMADSTRTTLLPELVGTREAYIIMNDDPASQFCCVFPKLWSAHQDSNCFMSKPWGPQCLAMQCRIQDSLQEVAAGYPSRRRADCQADHPPGPHSGLSRVWWAGAKILHCTCPCVRKSASPTQPAALL